MVYTKNKEIVSRIVHKHDTAANWENAKNFIPMKGEIIVYDIDTTHEHERFKIGDGVTLVNDLPFQVDISDFEDYKVKQSKVVDPSASGEALAFIDTIMQDEMGVITVTKKNVGKASTAGIADKLASLTVTLTGDVTGTQTVENGNNVSIVTDLSETGVIAGAYGTDGKTLNHGDTFTVPNFSVDAEGRLTAAANKTFTLPAPVDVSGQIDAHNTSKDAHGDIRNAIPTKTSELTNDSGFITGYTETDPTVPAWAKTPSKPTYTASEVGARPNTWVPSLTDIGVTATTNELNYVDGVTSNIQTQLNGKQATITGAATSITSANLTANRALVSDGSGKVAVSAVTSTELGYLDGVTSAVQSQLDAKIPLAGVSDYTITGNLLFADSGTTESVFRGLQGKCGGNDYWRVGGRATASNAGYMEIATADDGNEPIYVRQYSGTYSTLTRTATLLDGSGNTSFPGRVTAAGATLTSSLNLANGIWNKLGDDVLFGDNNTAGGFAIKGTNGNTNLKMVSNSNNTSASIVYDSTNECLNFVFA